MNQEDKVLTQKYGKDNPFVVPQGYFDSITSVVMDKIPEESKPTVVMGTNVWMRFRPVLLGAASLFVAAFSIIFYLNQQEDKRLQSNQVSTEELMPSAAYTDIDLTADYAMLDNEDIYSYVSEY